MRDFCVVALIIGRGDPSECPMVQSLIKSNIQVRFFERSGRNRFLEPCIRWLTKQLNDLKPDAFVPNLMIPAYFAAGFARRAGIPSIGVVHSSDRFHEHLLDSFVYGPEDVRVSSVVAVSKHLFQTIYPKAPRDLIVECIPCGVPVPPTGRDVRNPTLRVCYVGRFVQEQKRVLDVTKAFCRASKEIPGAVFTLLGNGPELENMCTIIDGEDVGTRVVIHSPLPSSEIQSFLKTQDVFVLLSDYEGLPVALQEAMAVGLAPVCLHEESGIVELIRHLENGIIVEDRDRSFLDALHQLNQDRDLINQLGSNARKTIELQYADLIQHDKWANLIRTVANQHSKYKIRLPYKLLLPAPHASFRGEDLHEPPFRQEFCNAAKSFFYTARVRIRPLSRLRRFLKEVVGVY